MEMTPFLKKILADGIRSKLASYTDDQLIEFVSGTGRGPSVPTKVGVTLVRTKKVRATRMDWHKFFSSAAAAGGLTATIVAERAGVAHQTASAILSDYATRGVLERVRPGFYRLKKK